MCSFRRNPYPPYGRSLELPWGRGVLQVKILEAKYKAKMELGGGGGAKQNFCFLCGEYGLIFWIYTITEYSLKGLGRSPQRAVLYKLVMIQN